MATALDEAQITAVSCSGLTVTQVGLPPGVPVEVALYDTSVGAPLVEVAARADAAGRLSVRLRAALRDVRQVVAEVEQGDRKGVEYGEVGADLPSPCSPTPRPLTRGSAEVAHETGRGGPGVAALVAAAAVATAIGGVALVVRSRRASVGG